jgi:hypothetical protein
MHRSTVAEQDLIGDAMVTRNIIEKIPQFANIPSKATRPPRTPEKGIANAEIDAMDFMPSGSKATCQTSEKWRARPLEKEKASTQTTVPRRN